MNQPEYSKMADFERTYWWHKGKLFLIKNLIEKYFPNDKLSLEILEIGCGAGQITKFFTNYGKVIGLDISEEAVEFCRQKGLKDVFQADILTLDVGKYLGKFDLILALDVLEHIQEDVEVMKKVNTMLKDGGLFFVNVPAHKFLWSEHDEALHHKR